MVKWIRKSIKRKTIVIIAFLFVFAAFGLYFVAQYAAEQAHTRGDLIRNVTVVNSFGDEWNNPAIFSLCDMAEEFYLSYDNLYEAYKRDKASVENDFNLHMNKEQYDQTFLSILEFWNLYGVFNIRLVLVDYSNGTLFTFLSTDDEYDLPSDLMWLSRKPGIKPTFEGEEDEHRDGRFTDGRALSDNEYFGYHAKSLPYRLYKDSEHNLYFYVFFDTYVIDSVMLYRYNIQKKIIIVMLFVCLIGLLIFRRVNRKIIKPLNSLTEATASLVSNISDENSREPVYNNITINTGDEIEELFHSFQAMESGLYDYMDKLNAAAAERERINAELSIAESIQMQMLPSVNPGFSDHPCFSIAASMHPAKEVGGDFYDFFMLSEDRLAFFIADVAGKGIPAALIMSIGKTMLENYIIETADITEAFRLVNNTLVKNYEDPMFITAFAGILNLRTGELVYGNAGHEDPFIMRSGGMFALSKEKHCIVLGALEDAQYYTRKIQLCPGDRMYLYTDGVPEAIDPDCSMFGLQRTGHTLNKYRTKTAAELIKAVRQSVSAFAKGEPQFDDMTMLCIDFRKYYDESTDKSDKT